jgi:hypothetical protein
MGATEIQDWQFYQLHWEDGWGQRMSTGQTIDLCLQTELTESNAIPERTRTFFKALRDRENEFVSVAAQDMLDGFNEIGKDSDDPDDRPEG